MKLWQKISIITLLFIIISILFTSVSIMNRFFDSFLAQEKEKNISIHYSYEELLANKVAYERAIQNTLLLSNEAVEEIIISMIDEISDHLLGIAVYKDSTADGSLLHSYQGALIQENIEFQSKVQDNSQLLSLQVDSSSDEYYILIGTTLSLETETYYLYTVHYINNFEDGNE